MIKLRDLLLREEILDPNATNSSFFSVVKSLEPEEVEFLTNYRLTPNYLSASVPPAQVQWQWTHERSAGNITYGLIFHKEVYHDSRTEPDVYNSTTEKRYKVICVSMNNANGSTGEVPSHSGVSDTFTDEDGFNLNVLQTLLDSLEYLESAYVEDIESPTFFGPASGFMQ